MELDSIDGLGMTIGDIAGDDAAAVANFRLTKRVESRLAEIQTNEVRPAFVEEMRQLVAATKAVADTAQVAFEHVGTT